MNNTCMLFYAFYAFMRQISVCTHKSNNMSKIQGTQCYVFGCAKRKKVGEMHLINGSIPGIKKMQMYFNLYVKPFLKPKNAY